jgi:acetyltransferase-like isoleucine patch superfamily enzyme
VALGVPSIRYAGIEAMLEERRIRTRTPEWREADVWIGAAATVLPGVRIGHDSVVGAGAVVAKDVPALTVVTGAGHVERRNLEPVPSSEI